MTPTNDPTAGATDDRPPPRRRPVLLASLLAGLLTAVVGCGLVLAVDPERATADLTALAFVAPVLVLVGHLWASRWRLVLSVVLTLVPGGLVAGAVNATARDVMPAAEAYVVVALGAVLAVVTAAVASWVANRWGYRRTTFLDAI